MTFVPISRAKSTAAGRHLPAARHARTLVQIGVLALAAGPLAAQQATRVGASEQAIYGAIGGPRLGQVLPGAAVTAGQTQREFTEVTLDGWMIASSLKSANRDGHNLQVRRAPVENLREAPNGKVLARVVQGFYFDEVARQGQWVHVRRLIWVATSGLGGPAAAAAAADQQPDPQRGVVRRRVELFRAPDSTAIGTLEAGHPVRITAHAGDWVRIEAQAWVRQSEVRPGDAGILDGLSAAELRGAPEEFRGKLLRWTIQFLSLQTADELRPDFTPGQKYILARGPAPEYAFVYIIVPADKLADVQKLQPLASVQIVARVVNGRSQYLANPILELVELE